MQRWLPWAAHQHIEVLIFVEPGLLGYTYSAPCFGQGVQALAVNQLHVVRVQRGDDVFLPQAGKAAGQKKGYTMTNEEIITKACQAAGITETVHTFAAWKTATTRRWATPSA